MNILTEKSCITSRLPELIRGGRLRKSSKGLISFAPFLAGASVLALGAMLATAPSAGAGECTSANSDGVYVCSDVAGSDMTANIRQQTNGGNLTVTSSADFGITVASGNAIDIDHGSNIGAGSVTAGELDVRLTGSGTITANNGYGVHVVGRFQGNALIDIQQNIDAAHQGVDIVTLGPVEDVTVRLRDVQSGVDRPGNTARVNDGVQIEHHGRDITFEVGAVTSEAEGVFIWHASGARTEGHGAISVTLNGAVVSGTNNLSQRQTGLRVRASRSASTTNVTTTADATITTSNGGHGIHLFEHDGVGDITLMVGGTITASGKGISIDQRTVNNRVQNNRGEIILDDPVSINTTVTTTATVAGVQEAIEISHMGRGVVTINAREGLTSGNSEAIDVTTGAASTGVSITTGISADGARTNIGTVQSGKDGISVNHQGTGDVMIRVGDNISTTGTAANCDTTTANCERGIDVATAASGGALTVEVTGNTEIRSHDEGIEMRSEGSGPVTLTVREDVNIIAMNGAGAYVHAGAAAESVTVNIEGDIGSPTSTNNSDGLSVTNTGSGILDVDITGEIRGTRGLILSSNGNADVYVNSLVNGESGRGIVVTNDETAGTDSFVIRLGPNADIRSSAIAMSLGNAKPGSETVVHLAGTITGGTGASAIVFEGAADRRLVIGTGVDYTITGAVNAGTQAGDKTIELSGAGDADFSLDDDLRKFTGFDILEKTGSGTWRLTNRQGNTKTFARIDVTEGKLVSEGLTQLIATNLNIAEGAIFEVEQESTALFRTAITLSGTIELSGTDTTLRVYNSLINNDGNVVIPVDFSDAGFEDGEHSSRVTRFFPNSVDGDPIVINIRAVGELPEEIEEPVRIENLVAVETANPDAFTAGEVFGGRMRLEFEVTDQGEWVAFVTRAGTGGIEEALYESLPAALAQLASLESHRQRLQGRQHGTYGGVWAKVLSASAEFEPLTTSLATYEIEDAVAEFGIDAPLFIAHPYIPGNFTVGATAALGDATTDVTANVTDAAVPADTGKIETGSFKAAISVHWEYEGTYVDGQLQYATFDNDIGTEEMKLGSTNANAYSGGLEVGYGGAVGDLLVIPSAQLLWTSVDFEDFTNSEGMEIVLDDGVVVTGRAGVGLEYGWRGALYGASPSGYVFLRGHADVLLPVDGDVNTRVDETEFVSKREDPVFDTGIGATYTWDGAYALSADVSTQQGEEVEGYAGSIGFKYKF